MSEEESIELLKRTIEYAENKEYLGIYCSTDSIKSILYLIENQKRNLIDYKERLRRANEEIEELKNKYSDDEIRNTVIKRCNEVIEKDYISKDKVREKIKELEDEYNKKFGNCKISYYESELTDRDIRLLQELLGEKDEK